MTNTTDRRRFDWRKPLIAAAVAFVPSLLMTIYGSDIDWLLYAPAAVVVGGFVLLVTIAVWRGREQRIAALAAFGAYVAVTAVFFMGYGQLHPILRWMLWSERYKAELLALPAPTNGQLKHLEWEVSGWGPVGPTIVYLVFDPADSLAAAAKNHRPGQFNGIPCEVPRVQRLEGNWYAVTFYTEESWGKHNRLNCRGAGT